MACKEAAQESIKDPNPVIDGRKANVNLAYLGAKPRSLGGSLSNAAAAAAAASNFKQIIFYIFNILCFFINSNLFCRYSDSFGCRLSDFTRLRVSCIIDFRLIFLTFSHKFLIFHFQINSIRFYFDLKII